MSYLWKAALVLAIVSLGVVGVGVWFPETVQLSGPYAEAIFSPEPRTPPSEVQSLSPQLFSVVYACLAVVLALFAALVCLANCCLQSLLSSLEQQPRKSVFE